MGNALGNESGRASELETTFSWKRHIIPEALLLSVNFPVFPRSLGSLYIPREGKLLLSTFGESFSFGI